MSESWASRARHSIIAEVETLAGRLDSEERENARLERDLANARNHAKRLERKVKDYESRLVEAGLLGPTPAS